MARGRWLRAALLLFLTVAKNFFLLPSPSFFFFCSQWLSVLGLVLVFWFRFPSSRFVSVLLSLSCLISLLPLSSGLLSPLLLHYFSLFIEQKTEQVRLLLVRLQSRNGWSAIDAFGGGGGQERERRDVFFKKFRLLFAVNSEGRRKMNSVVQNDTVLVFSLFFFYIYI